MYYFENDPLSDVHTDLRSGKTLSHFDEVLLLKNTVKDAFDTAAERFYSKNFQAQNQPLNQRVNRYIP